MSSRLCVPSQSENPLKLSPLYRDYWGEQMAAFTEQTDIFAQLGCYVPRFFHAPDARRQALGVPPNGYVTYLLSLPIGSFILGFLHSTLSTQNSTDSGFPPPNPSGFTCQITDQSIDHKWFSRPAEEAWFVNDKAFGSAGGIPPYPTAHNPFTFPSAPRLLAVPYPVIPPGQFLVEFWNALGPGGGTKGDGVNPDVQMTFLVMVPDGVNTNAGRGSGR